MRRHPLRPLVDLSGLPSHVRRAELARFWARWPAWRRPGTYAIAEVCIDAAASLVDPEDVYAVLEWL